MAERARGKSGARQPKAAASPVATMQENVKKFGIYLNAKEQKAVRINSPYWFPPAPQWTLLTPEVNMPLVKIRELAKARGVVSDPANIQWTSIPPKPEDLARWQAEERAKRAKEAQEKK